MRVANRKVWQNVYITALQGDYVPQYVNLLKRYIAAIVHYKLEFNTSFYLCIFSKNWINPKIIQNSPRLSWISTQYIVRNGTVQNWFQRFVRKIYLIIWNYKCKLMEILISHWFGNGSKRVTGQFAIRTLSAINC